MNFGTMVAELGNFTPSTGTTRDGFFINQAAHDFYAARRWSFLETTGSITLVAGTRGYVTQGTAPSLTDCDGVYDVELILTTAAAGVRIPFYSPQMFSSAFAHVFTNTQPSGWTILGGTAATTSAAVVSGGQQQLTLNYPPVAIAGSGQSLLCKYWRSAATVEMTANSDVPLAPVPYHRCIVQRGIVIAMEAQHLYAEAAPAQARYEEMLNKADLTDSAHRFSDFMQVEYRTLPQLDNRVVHSPNTYNPAVQPYPVAQS